MCRVRRGTPCGSVRQRAKGKMMARRKRRLHMGPPPDRSALLSRRLELIRQRHMELILRPRAGLANDFACDDECYDEMEDLEDLQLVGAFGASS